MSTNFISNRFAALDSDAEDSAPKPAGSASSQQQQQQQQPAGQARRQQQQQPQQPQSQQQSQQQVDRRGRRDELPRTRDEPAGTDMPVNQRRDIRKPRLDRRPERGAGRGREFERHSGTGRGREVKKQGGGAHNWGEDGVESVAPVTTAPAGADEDGSPTAAGGAPAAEEAKPEEEQRLDFAEYQRQLRKKRAAMAAEEEAAATRTVSGNELEKEGYQLLHRETVDDSTAPVRADDSSDDQQFRKQPANVIDLGSLRRGGRGRGRRDGEQQQQQQQQTRRPNQPKPNVSDASVFPAL